jgi:uncharacterized membrane protein
MCYGKQLQNFVFHSSITTILGQGNLFANFQKKKKTENKLETQNRLYNKLEKTKKILNSKF